jgi:hypothetical protein
MTGSVVAACYEKPCLVWLAVMGGVYAHLAILPKPMSCNAIFEYRPLENPRIGEDWTEAPIRLHSLHLQGFISISGRSIPDEDLAERLNIPRDTSPCDNLLAAGRKLE